VELATDYTVSHGEGVSIGLVVEARMAEELGVARSGLADEISEMLTGVGLPAVMPAAWTGHGGSRHLSG
jgi:3-dehydroquinate synthase